MSYAASLHMQRQTTVTAYMKSKQLRLFAFTRLYNEVLNLENI